MADLSEFFTVVRAYCRATGNAEATVSTKIFDDGKRIDKIRGGGDVGVRKLGRAFAWFSKNWPSGISWPKGVKRPRPRKGPPQ